MKMTGYGDKKSVEIAIRFGPNENPPTKTSKDDKEPSWLLVLRIINKNCDFNHHFHFP
jgi:hypothetical protein